MNISDFCFSASESQKCIIIKVPAYPSCCYSDSAELNSPFNPLDFLILSYPAGKDKAGPCLLLQCSQSPPLPAVPASFQTQIHADLDPLQDPWASLGAALWEQVRIILLLSMENGITTKGFCHILVTTLEFNFLLSWTSKTPQRGPLYAGCEEEDEGGHSRRIQLQAVHPSPHERFPWMLFCPLNMGRQ